MHVTWVRYPSPDKGTSAGAGVSGPASPRMLRQGGVLNSRDQRPVPPVGLRAPNGKVPATVRADIGLRIDRDGGWHYRGSPIGRKELVCLFASVLTRQSDGSYWLVTPAEAVPISVDDAPFVAVEVFRNGSGPDQALSFRTNVDEIVTLGPDHGLRTEATEDGTDIARGGEATAGTMPPYLMVRDGLEARLARPVYYDLVNLAVEEDVGGGRCFGVWSCGLFFRLARGG